MKRSHESSESLGAFMSMCPTAEEEHSPGSNHIYNSREYLSMLEGLDEEEGCGGQKKRRLSVDQVRALEKNFEKDNKLEPERKIKLAQDLGLQPRQVAVWFQNRRARWKTKQLERDYGVLKSNFDALNHNYESLLHEKEALLNEIEELKSRLQEENLCLSIKEEALLSECANKNTLISPPASLSLNEESDGANLKLTEKKKNADFKDGSSDSDSSAILNDDQSPNASNHQILMSPNSSTLRLNCSNSSSSPSSINCFAISDSGSDGLGGASHQKNNVYHPQFVKMEEHNFFGGEEACNFFSDEQAPSLHWYCPDQWN